MAVSNKELAEQLKAISPSGIELLYESILLLKYGYSMQDVDKYFREEFIRIYGEEPKM